MGDVVTTFANAVRERGVDVVETSVEELPSALETAAEPPVVGVPLRNVSVDLEAIDVDIEVNPTPNDLDEARTGITPVSMGIADYGSVVVDGGPDGEEPTSIYPDHHVAVLRADDVVRDMETAIGQIAASIRAGKRSQVIATGPSATADMGELVEGAHGPQAVTVVVVDAE